MEAMATIVAAVAGGMIAVLSSVVVAGQARRHDREQQARLVLVAPAEEFARSAVASLAALRYVTPPVAEAEGRVPHRNAALLTDRRLREDRLTGCRTAVDHVRRARAHVRLVYQPESWPAEMSRRVLADLRACLEAAEAFYAVYDDRRRSDVDAWAEVSSYSRARRDAYVDLDTFFEAVGERLARPSWDARVEPATGPAQRAKTMEFEP